MCFGSDDWEANNKSCFVLLVQTEVLRLGDPHATHIVFEAMRLKKASIPYADLDDAARVFVTFCRMALDKVPTYSVPEWILAAKIVPGLGQRTIA